MCCLPFHMIIVHATAALSRESRPTTPPHSCAQVPRHAYGLDMHTAQVPRHASTCIRHAESLPAMHSSVSYMDKFRRAGSTAGVYQPFRNTQHRSTSLQSSHTCTALPPPTCNVESRAQQRLACMPPSPQCTTSPERRFPERCTMRPARTHLAR